MILIFGVINQYGVLSHFSSGIQEDLAILGEQCTILPVNDGELAANILNKIDHSQIKFSICMNGSGLDTALTLGKTYALAVDHPLLLLPHLQKYKGYELLCVAKEHTAFANLLNIPAKDFFHAVSSKDITETVVASIDRTDEILFPASYMDLNAAKQALIKLGIFEQIKPALEQVKSINEFLMAIGVLPNGDRPPTTALDEKVYKITCEADRYIRALSRNQVLSDYQDKGVRLSVYGRNVRKYAEEYPEHDYHEEVPYTDLLKKMEKAKYVVHNSPGFLFAFHERLIFPLAKGTPVLFDATEHQKQMLNELPAIYPSTQVFNEYTIRDIEASIKRLRQSHTWIKRLSSLLI